MDSGIHQEALHCTVHGIKAPQTKRWGS